MKLSPKMSACFLRLHVCDVMQFLDDHARMCTRGPVTLVAYSKSKQCNKVIIIVLSSYVQATFGNIRTHVWR